MANVGKRAGRLAAEESSSSAGPASGGAALTEEVLDPAQADGVESHDSEGAARGSQLRRWEEEVVVMSSSEAEEGGSSAPAAAHTGAQVLSDEGDWGLLDQEGPYGTAAWAMSEGVDGCGVAEPPKKKPKVQQQQEQQQDPVDTFPRVEAEMEWGFMG